MSKKFQGDVAAFAKAMQEDSQKKSDNTTEENNMDTN